MTRSTHTLFHHGTAHADGFLDVEPSAVHEHAGSARVVDVREPHEFNGELGHIAGAALIPLATLATVAAAWDRDEDVVLVCRSGGRSAQAARQLVQMGFTRVMNMRGGMLAYNAARLPIERAAS